MTKGHAMITIDQETLERAKEKYLNISEIASEAVKKRLEDVEMNINHNISECEFCGRNMKKADKEDLNGLSWIFPDEQWICPHCLKQTIHRISAAPKIHN